MARIAGVDLPRQKHINIALMLPAVILVVAAYIRGRIYAVLKHPMLAGVKLWAFGHLLSAGTLADIVLFGSFLVWAAAVFAAARRRDRAAGTPRPSGALARDALAVVIGVAAWVAFAGRLHEWMVGVRPFG